jgi:hypothetical protein
MALLPMVLFLSKSFNIGANYTYLGIFITNCRAQSVVCALTEEFALQTKPFPVI